MRKTIVQKNINAQLHTNISSLKDIRMKNIIYRCSLFLCSAIVFLTACVKKDLPLNSEVVIQRETELEGDIKTALQSGNYGYVLYPESGSTSTKVTAASGFTLTFDTTTNQVTMWSTISGYTTPSTSYFTLSAATGMPLLIFSTNSYISQIYATGDQGITDYFFRVMKIDGDTIKVQPYRKGQIYASEGGPVFNMVKVKPSIGIPGRFSYDTIAAFAQNWAANDPFPDNPVKFGAELNVASYSSDLTVEINADLSLVNNFNTTKGKNYLPLPESTFDVTKKQVKILAGQKYSMDSFAIELKNIDALDLEKTYVLPLKATTPAGLSPGLKDIAYIVVSKEDTTVLRGSNMDRSTWKVSTSTFYSDTYSPLKALDGDINTSWLCAARGIPATYTIDMGSPKVVKGFTFLPYRNSTYVPQVVEVYSSQNGRTWKLERLYSSTATTYTDLKTIRFSEKVTAQYYRFIITQASGPTYTGFAEINGVE